MVKAVEVSGVVVLSVVAFVVLLIVPRRIGRRPEGDGTDLTGPSRTTRTYVRTCYVFALFWCSAGLVVGFIVYISGGDDWTTGLALIVGSLAATAVVIVPGVWAERDWRRSDKEARGGVLSS